MVPFTDCIMMFLWLDAFFNMCAVFVITRVRFCYCCCLVPLLFNCHIFLWVLGWLAVHRYISIQSSFIKGKLSRRSFFSSLIVSLRLSVLEKQGGDVKPVNH